MKNNITIKNNTFENLKNMTILIGPNGSGKTMCLKNIKEKINKEKKSEKIEILEILNENLKDSLDGKNSEFQKFIEKNKKEVIKKIKEDVSIKVELDKRKCENKKYFDLINEKTKKISIKEKEIEINFKFNENDFDNFEEEIKYNGLTYKVKKLSSGIRKLIEILIYKPKFKDNNKNKTLILIDEIDNFLHPNYIKLISIILKDLLNNEKFKVIISTHSSELLYLLNENIESLATANEIEKNIEYEIKYIDLEKRFLEFNKIIEKTNLSKKIDIKKYKLKIKTRFSMQLTRFLFSKKDEVIICEGITDQMFFKKITKKIIINCFGYFNLPLYLSLFLSLYNQNNKNISFILDGDDKLNKNISKKLDLSLMKEYLEENFGKENVFYFEKDIEQSLYKINKKNMLSIEKFNLLEKNFENAKTIIEKFADKKLLKILGINKFK